MALSDYKPDSTASGPIGGGLSSYGRPQATPDFDLTTAEGLANYARQAGLEDQVNQILDSDETPKLSVLQRLGKGLGAFNPAEAILTGKEDGVLKGVLEYPKDIVTGIGSAITGRDYEKDRRLFSDVVEEFGVENSIAKFGLGVLGDIFADPTTYFGGAIARNVLKGTKYGAEIAVDTLGKASPGAATKLRAAGTNVKEAFLEAFDPYYGVRDAVGGRTLEAAGAAEKAGADAAETFVSKEWGNLSAEQYKDAFFAMSAAKVAEFELGKGTPAGIAMAKSIIDNIADPSVQRVIADQLKKSGELATLAGIEDPYTVYMPFLKQEHQARLVQGSRSIRPGSQGWLKEFRNRLGIDEIVVDPMKAFSTRAYQIAKNAELQNQYKTIIKEFGVDADFITGQLMKEGRESFTPLTLFSPEVAPRVLEARRFATAADLRTFLTGQGPEAVKNFEQSVGETLEQFYARATKKQADYGTKVTTAELVKKARDMGYEPLYEKAPPPVAGNLKRYFKGEMETLEGTKEYVGVADAVPIGFLPKNEAWFIQNLNSQQMTTIDKIAKATGFDAVTALFKRSVTGLFLPFHIRNWASGVIQNYEVLGIDVLRPENVADSIKITYLISTGQEIPDGIIKIAGKPVNSREVFGRLTNRFGYGSSQYQSDTLNYTRQAGYSKPLFKKGTFIPDKEAWKEGAKATVKTAGLGEESLLFRGARSVGGFIEMQQKTNAFITALRQGKTVDDALKLAERAGFDYRVLTPFESKILRRIIPFYSFTRKNAELQLRTLGEHPERINQVLAVLNNVSTLLGGSDRDQIRLLPDYIKDSVGIRLQDLPNGIVQYIVSVGTPIEAFTNIIGGNPVLRAISMTNPILKAPIEIGIGKDSFRQKDLKDVYDAREYSSAPQIIKDILEMKEVTKPILRKNAQGKLEKVGERQVYVANPERLLVLRSLFTSRGFSYIDQIFDSDLTGFAKFLRLTTGVKASQFDLEQIAGIEEADKKRKLEDMLKKYGLGAEIRRFYVPNNE